MVELNVPYFKQVVIGSCGPASLLMVLKYHQPDLKLSRLLEIRAWSYASLFPFGMTDAHGLAGYAVKRGLNAIVLKEEQRFNLSFEYGPLGWFFNGITIPLLRFNYNRIRKKALKLGVEERCIKIDIGTIEELIRMGRPPIVMVDQIGYAPDDNWKDGVLHWVVVTGFDSNSIKINDPDIGPTTVPKADFEKSLDLQRNFRTDRRVVVVAPKTTE
ncbi:MAG: peptidase C39 family protein [Thaumarchaeota archaeon]|nr:peptidase C39 family protein [Nitrososphaerota archaeon]MCL5317607.1 peptidase C39 family protein [Nitrososphaerota archaeon]